MNLLFMGIITFLLHVLALKLAVSTMGVTGKDNRYIKALMVVVGLNLLGIFTGFIPLFSWPIYAALWVIVVMSAYRLSFIKSIGVAVMQVGIKIAIWALLKLVGMSVPVSHQLTMGL